MTAFLDRENCSGITLGLDLFHMRMEEVDLVETIRRYGKRIGLVQMMDDNRKAPGLGNFRFDRIVSAILETDYDGPVVMECRPCPDAATGLYMAKMFYHRFFGGKTNEEGKEH